jgi:hypothetical protein
VIRHAWSVLCEKHIIDRESNNISLDVIEQLAGQVATAPADGPILIPTPIRLVSLWYRTGENVETTLSRVTVIAPDGRELGHAEQQITCEVARVRAIMMLGAIPYAGAGHYQYVVSEHRSGQWVEVARVPLEVRLDVTASAAGA